LSSNRQLACAETCAINLLSARWAPPPRRIWRGTFAQPRDRHLATCRARTRISADRGDVGASAVATPAPGTRQCAWRRAVVGRARSWRRSGSGRASRLD